MENDIIITGPPRSGTTLTCFLLNKLENVIALHEPMNLKMFPNQKEALLNIQSFFEEMRHSALNEGKVISKVKAGKIPDNPFGFRLWGKRKSLVKRNEIAIEKAIDSNFKLAIKHNAHFTFLLSELIAKYPCYAIVRNPLASIASWNSVQAPVSKGNLTVLKTLNAKIYADLDNIPDLLDRQITLMDILFKAYEILPPECIIQYEEIIRTKGKALSAIIPAAKNLDHAMENKNRNKLYDNKLFRNIGERLLQSSGAYWNYYTKADVEALL